MTFVNKPYRLSFVVVKSLVLGVELMYTNFRYTSFWLFCSRLFVFKFHSEETLNFYSILKYNCCIQNSSFVVYIPSLFAKFSIRPGTDPEIFLCIFLSLLGLFLHYLYFIFKLNPLLLISTLIVETLRIVTTSQVVATLVHMNRTYLMICFVFWIVNTYAIFHS